MLKDMGMDDEREDAPVPLPNVNAAVLKRSLSGAPATRMTLLLVRMMKTKKSEQTIETRNS
jgi:hypothetical protein